MTTPESMPTIRRPTQGDAESTLQLMLRSDMAEYGLPDSDLRELLHDWSQMDLQTDAWLAISGEGEMVGYASVQSNGNDLGFEFYLDPELVGDALGQELLACCEARAQEMVQERGRPAATKIIWYIPHVNERSRRLAELAGFRPNRYIFNMQTDLVEPLAKPTWPESVTVRAARPPDDDRTIHELIQTAFERPGREYHPFDDWKAFMMREDLFQPELWFLAEHSPVSEDGELVGACLCFAYPDEGWVRQLGVAEAWRHQGLGRALLQHAFIVFSERGYGRVGLSVDGDNPNAYRFYERVGMRRLRQYDPYTKQLRTG